jgi:anti-sigma B factor antagonist
MSKLNISEREAGKVTILDMEGDITFGEGNIELRWTIRRLIGEGKKDILLNFSETRYVDSSGIGELISAMTAVNRENGQLKLLNVTPRLHELLAITRLLKVFELFEDERQALETFD